MAWIEVTLENLKDKISDDEYDAVTTASLPDGRTGPEIVADEITRTVNEARGYCPGQRAAGETIPDELLDSVLCILRHKVFSRLPGMKGLLDEIRVTEYNEALRKLRDVSAGRMKITEPVTPADSTEQAAPSTIETVSANTRRNTRRELEGLY